MSHNPLAAELAAAQTALAQLRDSRLRLDQELRWHAQFDPERTSADLRAVTGSRTDLVARIEQSRIGLADAQRSLDEHREGAALGWKPSRWFSDERGAAKRRYAEQQAVVDRLRAQHDAMEEQLKELEARKSGLESDLRRYAAVDAERGRERLAQIDGEGAAQASKVADLARRKERVDAHLAPLLSQLNDRGREAARLDHVLRNAESFQYQLDHARDGYARKQIHLRCEHELGRGSPGAVIHEVSKQRRALDRDVEKLQRRIADEARRIARDIRAVVIDGNNLCYEGSEFIGLAALIPVTQALSRAHDVTVVFDRSITTRWNLSEGDLASSLPGVKVHVVRSPRAADELILDVAGDSSAVVLSNDRFGEFRDKEAVRDGRLVKHDILKGRVSVPDLAIDTALVTP